MTKELSIIGMTLNYLIDQRIHTEENIMNSYDQETTCFDLSACLQGLTLPRQVKFSQESLTYDQIQF